MVGRAVYDITGASAEVSEGGPQVKSRLHHAQDQQKEGHSRDRNDDLTLPLRKMHGTACRVGAREGWREKVCCIREEVKAKGKRKRACTSDRRASQRPRAARTGSKGARCQWGLSQLGVWILDLPRPHSHHSIASMLEGGGRGESDRGRK